MLNKGSIIKKETRRLATSFAPLSSGPTFKSQYGLFVNGKFKDPSDYKSPLQYFDVHSPATGKYLTKVQSATADDVNDAVEIAHQAYTSGVWSRADVRDRAKVLNEIASLLRANISMLAELEVAQTGRAVREMKAQLAR